MEWIGIGFGLYVFFSIGLYHILVVQLEARFGSRPWIAFLLIGLVCLYLAITTGSHAWSMFWGYNAFLNLWTIKEMFEQVKRAAK